MEGGSEQIFGGWPLYIGGSCVTFRLINICLSLSDDANKMKTLNIERA